MRELLKNKNSSEKELIKAREIAKLNHRGRFTDEKYNVTVDILELKQAESKGHFCVEILARAWKNGIPLGFGKDGSVEIERFRIFNPPILVNDPNGDVVREWNDEITGEVKQRKLREDPIEAIRQSLVHTVFIVGKENRDIIKGKIGNTTTTIYPNAGTGTAPVDGEAIRSTAAASWSSIRDGVGNSSSVSINNMRVSVRASTGADNWNQILRVLMGFDTASIDDTDVIDSATISVWKDDTLGAGSTCTLTESFNFTEAVFGDVTTISNSDYEGNVSYTTQFATAKACGDVINGQYNDWTLNANGRNHINKTGKTYFALKPVSDITNTPPTWIEISIADFTMYSADATGTTNDPKLVIVHTGGSAPNDTNLLLMGIG